MGVGGQNLRGFESIGGIEKQDLRSEQPGPWKKLIAEEKRISVVESGRD